MACWGFGFKRYDLKQQMIKVAVSIVHDPVSGSQSNRILQFRTGSGLDWISKKLDWVSYGYPNCIDHCSIMLNESFSDINRIGLNIWTGLPD